MDILALLSGTAERNLEWGDPSSKAEGAIHLGGVRADWPWEILKTETLKVRFPAIWSSNFSCSSVTLQDLVTLWSRNAFRNCVCGEKWGGHAPPAPPAPRSLVIIVT